VTVTEFLIVNFFTSNVKLISTVFDKAS